MAAPVGNKHKEKYKTPEARRKMCELACDHLRKGLTQDYFPECDWDTVEHYMRDYPLDVPPEKIAEAKKQGLATLEGLGQQGAKGEIPGFNATAWIFLMKNKAGWKDRQDVTTNDQSINFTVTRSSHGNQSTD